MHSHSFARFCLKFSECPIFEAFKSFIDWFVFKTYWSKHFVWGLKTKCAHFSIDSLQFTSNEQPNIQGIPTAHAWLLIHPSKKIFSICFRFNYNFFFRQKNCWNRRARARKTAAVADILRALSGTVDTSVTYVVWPFYLWKHFFCLSLSRFCFCFWFYFSVSIFCVWSLSACVCFFFSSSPSSITKTFLFVLYEATNKNVT